MKRKIPVIIFCILLLFVSGCNVATIPTDNSAKVLYNSLEKEQVTDKNQKPALNINKENLKLILSQISRPLTYTWEMKITYTSSGKNLVYNGRQYLYQNKIRSEKYNENFRLLQFSLFQNNTSYMIDNSTKEYYIHQGEKPYFPDIFLNVSNPIAMLSLSELDSISNISVDFLNDQSVIYFEINDNSLSLYEKYWISIDTGIPLRVESYFLGGSTYIMTTTDFKSSVSDTSIFKLPSYVK